MRMGDKERRSFGGGMMRTTRNPRAGLPGSHSLRSLSDRELLKNIGRLCDTERVTVLKILVYLLEIDRRRLYLPLGYASLFEFCLRRLGYSEPQAGRRVALARCIGQFPRIYDLLASGRVNFSAVSRIAGIMDKENADEILCEIEGKTVREIEGIVSRYRPGRAIRERVRPVWVRTELQAPDREGTSEDITLHVESEKFPEIAHLTSYQEDARCQSGTQLAELFANAPGTENKVQDKHTEQRGSQREHACVVFEQRYKVEFGVDPGFLEKLERVRALLSTKLHRRLELEELFGIVMDEYIGRHAPENRIRKRSGRGRKASDKHDQGKDRREKRPLEKRQRAGHTSGGAQSEPPGTDPRHIPRRVRDEVWARDGGRCAFVSATGRRCGSTWDLQIDHIVPVARGGDCSPQNLRLLCAKHNRLEAERVYGKDHMAKFGGT